MRRFKAILDLFVKTQRWVAIALLAFIIISNVAELVVRMVTGSSIMFNQELTVISCVWSVFLGWSVLCHQNKDLTVDILTIFLHEKILTIMSFFVAVIVIAFMFVLIYSSGGLILHHYGEYSDVVRIPLPLYSLPLVISGISITFSCIYQLITLSKSSTSITTESHR